jgi:histidinol-phosphate aminotransferase
VAEYPNVVVLRTFSKWAGLAGLRVGYGIFPPGIIEHLWKVKPPFNVNVAAEAAVLATLHDQPRLQVRVAQLIAERARMHAALSAVSRLKVWPSVANYLLVQTDEPTSDRLKDRLAVHGVAVRTYAHPRLRNAVRISVGLPAHTDAVVTAATEWARGEEGA